MPRRITVDENGLVVAVESVPERMGSPSSKGSTRGMARKKRRRTPNFEWNPSTGQTTADYSASGLARRRARESRRAKEGAAQQAEAVARARRQAEEVRAVAHLTDFEEVYVLGVNASKGSPPNFPLAIAAFSKAYRLDPRRKVKPGAKPDPGLFEVPTRLAAAYRLNKQPYQAQKMYEWVLEHHDSQFARVGLAAVYEDKGKHVQALKLYQSVLNRNPDNRFALRGVARTLANLGRDEEASKAYKKARRLSGDYSGSRKE